MYSTAPADWASCILSKMNHLINIKKPDSCHPSNMTFPAKRGILLMLDLPIWNFDPSGLNAVLDCIIFIDLKPGTNHL